MSRVTVCTIPGLEALSGITVCGDAVSWLWALVNMSQTKESFGAINVMEPCISPRVKHTLQSTVPPLPANLPPHTGSGANVQPDRQTCADAAHSVRR